MFLECDELRLHPLRRHQLSWSLFLLLKISSLILALMIVMSFLAHATSATIFFFP